MNEIIPGYDCVADVRRIREALYHRHNGDTDAMWESLKTAKQRYFASLDPETQKKLTMWSNE